MLEAVLSHFVPNQAGVLWLAAAVALVLFGDFTHWRSRRNAILCGLLAMGLLLLDVSSWQGQRAAWIFTAIYIATACYAGAGFTLSRWSPAVAWVPNLSRRGLAALVVLLLAADVAVVLGRPPDDAGYYTNLGALRWTETGLLPYADAKLRGPDAPAYGAAATYGPLLYVAHVPFQRVLGVPRNPPDADPILESYRRPPVLATQLTCLTFFLLGLWALYRIVARATDPRLGLAAVALYAGSPYVLGLGGDEYLIGGLVYISHIAPSSTMLLALLAIERPALCGLLLAAAAGVLFYPAFMFPLWFGWFLWQRRGVVPFTTGFTVGGLAILGLVLIFTPAPEGTNSISMFLESTLEHQEGLGSKEYGGSPFGFWGTHPELAAFWQVPLFGTGSLFKPTFLIFASFAASAFFLARGRSLAQLAALTAMVGAAVQLWKTHAAGSYVEWYYPFLLIALLASSVARSSPDETASEARSSPSVRTSRIEPTPT